MQILKKHLLLTCLTISTLGVLLSGCTEQIPPQQVAVTAQENADYSQKIEILDQVEPPMTALGLMTNIVVSEWPQLFTAKSEDELLQRYALLTWNPTENNKRNLIANLERHPEYASYIQLYKSGKLPAQQVTVKDLSVTLADPAQKTYKLNATYSLLLKDGSQHDVLLDLQVGNQGLDVMNNRFNTDGDVSEGSLPEPTNEQGQQRQDFMMRVLKQLSWKLNPDQMTELLK